MSELPRTRDSMGRFITGNPGGPGRKPRETEKQYLMVMEQVTGLDVWRQIVERAVTDAIGGDARARDWLSGYLLGQPIARVQEVEDDENAITYLIRQMREGLREEATSLQVQGYQLSEKQRQYLDDSGG